MSAPLITSTGLPLTIGGLPARSTPNAIDVTAPVLSLPTGAESGTTSFTGSVVTDEGNGTLNFVVIPSSSASPNATQIEAGTDGNDIPAIGGLRTQAVSASGTQNVSGSGLTENTSVKVAYTQRDAAGNLGNAVVSAAFTTDAVAISGNWYDTVFARRDGVGVGPRVATPTTAISWATGTAGVSDDGAAITIGGANVIASALDFTGRRILWTGNNPRLADCYGAYKAGGTNGCWYIEGDDPLLEYFELDNSVSQVNGTPMLYFGATLTTGTVRVSFGHFKDTPNDIIKAPNNAIIQIEDCVFKGYYLAAAATHMDFIDMKGSNPGSYVKRCISIGDWNPASPFDASTNGTGFNDTIRCADGHDGSDKTYEQNIFVGSNDPFAAGSMLTTSTGAVSGVRVYDCLYDLRQHVSFLDGASRVDDWYVRSFDYAASLIAGQVTGISAPVAYPWLGAHPAAVPSTMAAPVLSVIPNGFAYAEMARPFNQRALITQFDIRYSVDGTVWTTLTNASAWVQGDLTVPGDTIEPTPASNYRQQIRAVNAIGPGAWSASSNLVNVSAATISVSEPPLDGHPYDVGAAIGRNLALWPVTVTTTNVANGTEVYAERVGAGDTAQLIGTITSNTLTTTYSAPLSASTWNLKVYLGSNPNINATTGNRFGTGHVMVMHSQSEPHRCFESFYSDAPNNPVEVDWNNLTFLSIDHLNASPTVVRIDRNSGTNFTTAMKYLSNALAQVAPGEKFVLGDAMEPGTGFLALMNDATDATDDRKWTPHYQTLLDYLRTTLKDGASWNAFCWWAQDRANYRLTINDSLMPQMFGQTVAGSTFTLGATNSLATIPGAQDRVDHFMTDADAASNVRGRGAWSADEAKWTFFMNGFTHDENLSTFEVRASDGQTVAGMRNIRETMQGLRSWATDARMVDICTPTPVGFGAQVCKNNGSHPSETSRDGLPIMAEIIALNWLKAIGRVTAPVPTITGCAWNASFVDVSVNVGVGNRLTTYRAERSLGAVTPASHRMAVAGFAYTRGAAWNWPTSVAITNDGSATGTATIRVTASFQSGDVLNFMGGGGTGQLLTSDIGADYHLNIPVVKIAGVTNPMPPVESAAQGSYLTMP